MQLRGIGAAPGQAVGPVWRHRQVDGAEPVLDVRAAAAAAGAELLALADRVRAGGRADEAGIFEAQALMADDPALLEDAEARIAAQLTVEEKLARAKSAGLSVDVIDTSGTTADTDRQIDRLIERLGSLPPRVCS